MIGHNLSCSLRHSISHVIKLFQGVLHCLARISFYRIAICIIHPSDTPSCHDIVQRVMGIVTNGEVIVARVKHIGALLCGVSTVGGIAVIGGEHIIRKAQGNRFALTFGQSRGLFKIHQLDRALLCLSLFIGKLHIKLNYILRCAVIVISAMIRHLDLGGNHMGLPVPVNADQFLREVCIAHARTEGKHHLVSVIPFSILGCVHALSAVSIIDTKDFVLIAGLIILIAHIDSFGIDQVLVFIEAGQIGKCKITRVLHSCRGQGIRGIGNDISAGWIGLACKNACYTDHTIVARISNPEACVHAIFFQPVQLHGIPRVDYNNQLLELAGFLYHIQRVDFFLVQGKLRNANWSFLPITLKAVIQIAFFAAKPAHYIDCRIIEIRRIRTLSTCIRRGGNFSDQPGLGSVGWGIGNRTIHRFVDPDAFFFQRIIQVDAGIGRATGAAMVNRSGSSIAKQRHTRSLG